jgi:hypothetical protein
MAQQKNMSKTFEYMAQQKNMSKTFEYIAQTFDVKVS